MLSCEFQQRARMRSRAAWLSCPQGGANQSLDRRRLLVIGQLVRQERAALDILNRRQRRERGVGRGTTIEYVESYAAADDGFEFFGGTVNAKYLVSSFNDDDSFDVDMGYRGTNQFWFAIQAPDKRNYGMELNNHPNELHQTSQLLPATDFKVYNLTIIGSGASSTNVNGGVNAAIALRPWVGPKIYNAIFTDFNAQGVLQ